MKYFPEYLIVFIIFRLEAVGVGSGVGGPHTIHFVIHNKSRPEPGSPQSVPKILMTLSGDDCLG